MLPSLIPQQQAFTRYNIVYTVSLCISVLCFHPIFSPHTLVASDAVGKFNFYDDYDCNTPSTLNPVVSVTLSTCLVFPGAEGLVIGQLPPCPQGTAAPIYYSDPACGVQTSNVSPSIFSKSCQQLAAGTGLYDAKSLMLSCQAAADNPVPSSTTTAVISGLAPVATGSTGSNSNNGGGSGSGSGSASTTSSAGGSSSTGTNTQLSNNNNISSSSSSSQGATTTSTNSGSGSGLDTGDIIALAVGLGVGIPSIIVAILAWRFPTVRNKVTSLIPGFSSSNPHHDAYSQQQQWPYSRPQELPVQSQQQFPYQQPVQEMDSQARMVRYQ